MYICIGTYIKIFFNCSIQLLIFQTKTLTETFKNTIWLSRNILRTF